MRKQRAQWDERLLFAPLRTLPVATRWVVVVLGAALTLAWSALINKALAVAWGLPDVSFYTDMAEGHYERVPAPFTSRPLAPLLMHWVAGALHLPMHGGMELLAVGSLLWSAGVVLWLLAQTGAPRWTVLAVAALPFWTQLLSYAGLPDPLYAALTAGLLLALAGQRWWWATGLMLPMMLTRESTWLVVVCLLLVGWRQLRWAGAAVAVGSAAVAAVLVRHVSAGGLPNPEHLSGGLYLVGKVISNSVRSVGLMPWSNVYPALCATPAWQMPLHVSAVRSVGVCQWSPGPLYQSAWALLVTFGALPSLLLLGWKALREEWRASVLVRFSLLYGGVSLLIAPALGTWYLRLFAYGWPLLLVAAPRVLARCMERSGAARAPRGIWGLWVVAHVLICAESVGFPSLDRMGVEALLQGVAIALGLVHRGGLCRREEAPVLPHPAC